MLSYIHYCAVIAGIFCYFLGFDDFEMINSEVAFGSTSVNGSVRCINISTTRDGFVESSELFAVEIAVSGNDVIQGNSSQEITIEDNDCEFG